MKQFEHFFNDKRAIVAAAATPCFKLEWAENDRKEEVKQCLLEQMKSFETPQPEEDENQEKEAFLPRKKKQHQSAEAELARFLSDPWEGKDSLQLHPLVKQVFLKNNAILLSSATCKWLFSHGKFIFHKNRPSLKDINFQMQLLMNINNVWN